VGFADKWGCFLRTCLEMTKSDDKEQEHEDKANKAALDLALNPQHFLHVGLDSASEDTAHTIICVRPDTTHGRRNKHKTEIPTDHLRELIARQVAEVDTAKQSDFFSQISSHPWLKAASSYLFEKFLHIRLTTPSQAPLECRPLIAEALPLTIPICQTVIPLNGVSNLKDAKTYTEPFYWRPTHQIFPVVDAIICTSTEVILLQCTVSKRHKTNTEKLQEIVTNLGSTYLQRRRLCLVFTVDSKEAATAVKLPQSEEFTQLMTKHKISVYTTTCLIGRPLDKAAGLLTVGMSKITALCISLMIHAGCNPSTQTFT
jgi:hypothetical protein